MKKSITEDVEQSIPRRAFLKGAVVTGTAIGGGVLSGHAIASDVIAEPQQAKVNKRYRETEHIRDYYKSAQF